MPAQPLIARKPQFNAKELRQEGNYPQQRNWGFQGQQNGGNQFDPQGVFPRFGSYKGFGLGLVIPINNIIKLLLLSF